MSAERPFIKSALRKVAPLAIAGASFGACASGGEAQPPLTSAAARPTTIFDSSTTTVPDTTTSTAPTTTAQVPIIVGLGPEGVTKVAPATTIFETTTTAYHEPFTPTGEFNINNVDVPLGLFGERKRVGTEEFQEASGVVSRLYTESFAQFEEEYTGVFADIVFGYDINAQPIQGKFLLGIEDEKKISGVGKVAYTASSDPNNTYAFKIGVIPTERFFPENGEAPKHDVVGHQVITRIRTASDYAAIYLDPTIAAANVNETTRYKGYAAATFSTVGYSEDLIRRIATGDQNLSSSVSCPPNVPQEYCSQDFTSSIVIVYDPQKARN